MSLVAYAASDDSGTDEEETADISPQDDNIDGIPTYNGQISDEEDYMPTNRNEDLSSSPSSLSALPLPKSADSSSTVVDESELEEEVKPKQSQIADAPTPPSSHKHRQPAKILIPSLAQYSDEEDDSDKKPKQIVVNSGKRSGLFSLLPPPVHASKKEAQRPLIPYTLTKRTIPASILKPSKKSLVPASSSIGETDPLPSKKHQSAFNALTGYESDSDEDEGVVSGGANFFSLDTDAHSNSVLKSLPIVKNLAPEVDSFSEPSTSSSGSSRHHEDSDPGLVSSSTDMPGSADSDLELTSENKQQTVQAISSTTTSTTANDIQDVSSSGDAKMDVNNRDTEQEDSVVYGVPILDQDRPLSFKSTDHFQSWSSAPLVAPMMPEMYARHSGFKAASAAQWQKHLHFAQDTLTDQLSKDEEPEQSMEMDAEAQQFMDDKQFLRLGGKRKRSAEIRIIDANVDDHVDPSELMKGITEESTYQPRRSKDNLPSSQQRRKKQITYLAFQAKERELELKNTWSENKLTKSHARSKYGF